MKFIGGGPLYPVPADHEKKIVDLDDSCQQFKNSYVKTLERAW